VLSTTTVTITTYINTAAINTPAPLKPTQNVLIVAESKWSIFRLWGGQRPWEYYVEVQGPNSEMVSWL
jgi:hypothetical protein